MADGGENMEVDESEPSTASEVAPSKRSTIWKHIAKTGTGYKCLHCSHPEFSLKTGYSSMRKHLSNKHEKLYKPEAEQPTGAVPSEFQKKKLLKPPEKTTVDKKVVDWVVMSSQPFSVVDEKEFRTMMGVAFPGYVPPCRKSVKEAVMSQYAGKKAQVARLLRDISARVSLTTDGWTSPTQEHYVVITAHWISDDFVCREVILDFVHVPEEQNAENIREVVLARLQEFRIVTKVLAVTTDGTAVMPAFFRLLAENLVVERRKSGKAADDAEVWLWCLPHLMQVVVKVAVEEKNDLVLRIRKQVIFIHQPRMKAEFRRLSGTHDLKLPLDVRTRWDSTLRMCDSAYNRREEITEFLYEKSAFAVFESKLSEIEWEQVKDFVNLLTPFAEATTESSAHHKPTIHMASTILRHVERHLDAVSGDIDQANWVKKLAGEMKIKLAESLEKAPSWTSMLPDVASALDPRKKDSGISTAAERDALRAEIRRRILKYSTASANTAPNGATRNVSSGSASRLSIFEREIVETCGTILPIFDEVETYFGSQREPIAADILQYWNSKKATYPKLARLAADVLGICSSSVASESWFSVGRKTITDVRNRLGTDTVEALICLRSWKSLVEVVDVG